MSAANKVSKNYSVTSARSTTVSPRLAKNVQRHFKNALLNSF